jgi:replication factor A1
VLEPEAIVNQKSDNKSLKFKVFISDGYTKHKAVLGNEASLTFDAAGQPPFCVIRVQELMQQNAQPQKRLVIITRVEIINSEVNELIGQPMEYQEWLGNNKQNRSGSSQIPAKFLSNFKSQNQPTNFANNSINNNSMNSTPYQNNSNNSFNKQQQQQPPAAAVNQQSSNFNQRASNPPTNQAPSRNSMGGGNNFNNNNNNNNMMNNMNSNNNNNNNNFNNQRNMNPSNSNKFINQNENIPPSGNSFKGQQDQKRGSISYLNQNQFNVPEEEFLALNQLAPYAPFIIKARITNKSGLRTFAKQNSMGTGHVFSVDLIDKEGNEITATFFGEAAEKFHEVLEENAVYIMRNGNVKMVSSKYNKKPNNDYQIIFDKVDALIQKVDGDTDIMVNKFNFAKLNTIEQLAANETIDIAAYIKEARQVTEVTLKKAGEQKQRRVITLFDNSNTLVEMTLWGDIAAQDLQPDTLVLIKNARVSEFNGLKGLSSSFTTKIIDRQDLIPDEPEIRQLREWKQNEFSDDKLDSKVSQGGGGRKYAPFTIEEINNLSDKVGEAAFFDLTAYVGHIKTETPNLYYAACPQCNRKIDDDGGIAKCNTCNKNFPAPAYRYTLSIKLSDHTGSLWISAFDQVAQVIVGENAQVIRDLKAQQDESRISEIFRDAHHKEFTFKLLAKQDVWNGNTRVKIQAIRVAKIEYVKHAKDLLTQLEAYSDKNESS